MNSLIKLRYIREYNLEFPNDFNILIEDIKKKFKIDKNELIILQFIFYITNGEKMIIEINDEEQYQYYKQLYENNCTSIEVNIRNLELINTDNSKDITEEINKMKLNIDNQGKNINEIKYKVEKNQNLDEQILLLNKKIEDINNLYDSKEEKKINDKLLSLNYSQTDNNDILSCKYIENEKLTTTKSTIIKNYVIEHYILIENTSKNNLEWPINTFLRCVNDDSDIYFYNTSERIKNTDSEDKNNIYIFKILVLFKNYKNIKEGEYTLKYQLINDFYGIIGEDYGNLTINVIQ